MMTTYQYEGAKTLFGLIEHFSPSGSEAQAVSWLVEHMQTLGFQSAFVDPAGNAVGVMGEGERQIILLGHIDTVPGEIPIRLQDDSLYGRGAVDAKGPLAAFVDAVAGLGVRDGWQMVVIGAVDEERQSVGAVQVAHQYRPNYAIIGEPSSWNRCTLGYKGSASAIIYIRRPQAHSASAQQNACETAFETWTTITSWAEEFNLERRRLFDRLQVNLNSFRSGADSFEDWAELDIGARLPLDFSPEDWFTRLEKLAEPASITPIGQPIYAYRSDKNNPLVRALLAGIRSQGGKPGFVVKTGTADINIVAPVWGCPAVAYGPGDSVLDHTAYEHISLREYHLAVAVLKETLLRLTRSEA